MLVNRVRLNLSQGPGIQPLDINMTARTLILLVVLARLAGPANAQTPQRFRAALLPPDTRITLEEYGCLVTIAADGKVSVEGESGFEFDILRVRERISLEELNELVLRFTQIDYFLMNDHYRGKEDGCPVATCGYSGGGIVTSFRFNGRSKTIAHHTYACLDRDGLSYPRELTHLEKEIKDVVGLKRR